MREQISLESPSPLGVPFLINMLIKYIIQLEKITTSFILAQISEVVYSWFYLTPKFPWICGQINYQSIEQSKSAFTSMLVFCLLCLHSMALSGLGHIT